MTGDTIAIDMQVQLIAAAGRRSQATTTPSSTISSPSRARDKTVLSRDALRHRHRCFRATRRATQTVEELEQTIPLADGETGANIVIVVGIELTPEELEYNRRQGR